MLEHLRHIRSAVDALRDDMREVKARLATLEEGYASVSLRIDRLDERIDRIERQIALTDVSP